MGAAALIAAGIGLLMIKPWARWLSIVYALVTIVFALIGLGITYVFTVQPVIRAFSEQQPPDQPMAGAIGGAAGTMCGSVIALAYPIVLLIFMTRPHVVQAMSGK